MVPPKNICQPSVAYFNSFEISKKFQSVTPKCIKVLSSSQLGATEQFHPDSPKYPKFKSFVQFGLTKCFHLVSRNVLKVSNIRFLVLPIYTATYSTIVSRSKHITYHISERDPPPLVIISKGFHSNH